MNDINQINQFFNNPPHLVGALFWLHGTETREQLWTAFRNVVESGIGELVLESRPHWNFMGPKWWSDLKLLLEWSAHENIKTYLFDEKWFPSGVAGNVIQKFNPDFRRMSVRYQSIRYRGPQSNISIMLPWTEKPDSSIIGVYAYPVTNWQINWEENIDLTKRLLVDSSYHMHGIMNALRWDVPEGDWIVIFIITDREDNYIDPMNPEAVQAFIDYVYESSRQQLTEYFGKSLAGFFFDEPGYFCDVDRIPWSPGIRKAFIESKGYDLMPYMPLIWLHTGAHYFKYDFFNVLNTLYAETYYKPIQTWCHKYNLKIIGHWYEHEACPEQGERFMFHERLGEGPGDFFEVSKYADEGGVDLVCNQIIPGEQNRDYWGLPKLASSVAHIYNLKDDLAMCEAFGAYGWHIGLRMMKWLTDWQAVRGINHFILHAFNPRFPDLDCPPYYYDGGYNPQWPYFSNYVKYVNRLAFFLRGGKHIAPLLVLYPGAMGYAGKTFPIEDTQRFLQEIQCDYDLVPAEVLINEVRLISGRMLLHKESYQGIAISGQEVITEALLKKLFELSEARIPIFFLYQTPRMILTKMARKIGDNTQIEKLLQNNNVFVIDSHMELESYLHKNGIERPLEFCGKGKSGLRVLNRLFDNNVPMWFLNNENVNETVSGKIILKGVAPETVITAFEPLTGEAWDLKPIEKCKNAGYEVLIPPYHSLILVPGELMLPCNEPAAYKEMSRYSQCISIPEESITLEWVSGNIKGLPSWLTLDKSFSGTADYVWNWNINEIDDLKEILLDIGEVYEITELYVNDIFVGSSIVPPYRFHIRPYLHNGMNSFRVKVTNVISNKMRDSREFEDITPSWKKKRDIVSVETDGGLLGPISIYF